MSRGPTRLLQDRGLQLALLGLGIFLIIGVVDRSRHASVPAGPAVEQALDLRVACDGRYALGAVVTMRPLLEDPASWEGRGAQQLVTPRTGRVSMPLPYPVPPGFSADVLAAHDGCVTSLESMGAYPPEREIPLLSVQVMQGPRHVQDPPQSPVFPPAANEEQVRALRVMGTGSHSEFIPFEQGVPACGQCHQTAAAEHASAHGRAPSPALKTLALQAQGQGGMCARCHAPVDALASPSFEAPIRDRSAFSCSACHLFKPDPKSTPGNGLGVTGSFRQATVGQRIFARGVRADTASPAMAVEFAPELAGNALCASCHAWTTSAAGALLTLDPTVEEHAAWEQSAPQHNGKTCVACHMPDTGDSFLVDGYARWMWGVARPGAGRRSHAGVGDRAARLQEAVMLEAHVEGGTTLVVELRSKDVGHALPGVSPLLAWNVVVLAGVAEGAKLEDGRAGVQLARVLGRGADDVCALPWEASRVVEDTRLMPGARLRWEWTLMAPGPVEVVLEETRRCAARAKGLGLAQDVAELQRLHVAP